MTARVILVTGARDWPDPRRVAEVLDHAAGQAGGPLRLLVGDAPGADSHARAWAKQHGVPVEVVPARWDEMAGEGRPRRAAGPERNRAMLDRLDRAEAERLVLAFHDDLHCRSTGTRHCTSEARRRGYPVALVTSTGRQLLPPRPNPPDRARALREAALAYAARGIPVLPLHTPLLRPTPGRDQAVVAVACSCADPGCDRPSKHPRTRLVPHGVAHATHDPEQIQAWWRRAPHANIGLATGHTMDVLDCDGPEGVAALRAFAAKHGWTPSGPLVRTGRGWHLYLHPAGCGPRNPIHPELLAHVDWRGKGAYAIAPPSRHAHGAYTWARGLDTPLAPAPPALLDLLRPRRAERATAPVMTRPVAPGHPYGQAALTRECGALAAMGPDSGRNRRLFDAGIHLYALVAGGVLDETQVEQALLDAAERCGLLATEATATRLTIKSARTIGLAHPHRVPDRPTPPTPAQRPPATRARPGAEHRPEPARGLERG
jgi:hypothetical protein